MLQTQESSAAILQQSILQLSAYVTLLQSCCNPSFSCPFSFLFLSKK